MIYQDVFAPAAQCRCRRAILAGMVTMAYRVIPAKVHSFNVEMNNLKGKCSLIPGFRDKSETDAWVVQTKRMLHELDPTDKVTAHKSGKPG
jgi:hypothetical protein